MNESNRLRASLVLCCLVIGIHSGFAQWNLVQNAASINANCVQLTSASPTQRGAAWHDCQIHLDAAFDLEFTVNLGNNDGGADGMCFILQQAGNIGNNLVGASGGSIGYSDGPFTPSLAVEIDTWQNGGTGDPVYDHIGICRDGENNHNVAPPVQANVNNANIETGLSYPFRVTWDPATTLLEVFFNGELRHSVNVDLIGDVFGNNPLVYWGWTGTTGGATNNQSFCLVDAYYSTHIESVTAMPEGPWEVCEGEELILTATALPPATSASWPLSGAGELVITAAGNYTLFATDDGGCPTHGTISVDAKPGPELALLVDPELLVCGEVETTLLASAVDGASLNWNGVDGGEFTIDSGGTYDVEAELDGCVESASVTVTYQAIPTLQITSEGAVVAGGVNICPGDEITLSVSAPDGGVATWNSNGSSDIVVDDAGNFTASAIWNGCESDPEEVEVNLFDLPEAEISATPSTLCWETVGVVEAFPMEGTSIVNWVYPSGTTSLGNAGPGQYELSLVNNDGCETVESFDYIMLPPINTGLTDPEPLCDGSVAYLNVTGAVDGLAWNIGGNNTTLAVTSLMGSGPFVANVTLGACAQSDTAFVTWWPTPTIGAQPDTVTRCVLDPAFSLSWPEQDEDAVGYWLWEVNGNSATAGYSVSEEGDYLIEVRDNATGCMDSHNLFVEVWPNLAISATPEDPLICLGDSTSVQVELLTVQDTDPYEIPFSVLWSTEDASGWESVVGAGEHLVTATNACGTASSLVVIQDEYCGCNVWVPNAFTPDKDGLNDGFEIVSSCEWDVFQFSVFNRWGQLVWQTEDPDKAWDGGTTLLGQGQHFVPDGQYAYRLHYEYSEDGEVYTKDASGRIVVIR